MSEIRAKSEIKLNNGITWTFVKGNKLDYVINILSGGEYQQLKAANSAYEQLQATNQELLSALEWIVSEIKDCAQPEDWESFDACEEAITNAKQVMGDKG